MTEMNFLNTILSKLEVDWDEITELKIGYEIMCSENFEDRVLYQGSNKRILDIDFSDIDESISNQTYVANILIKNVNHTNSFDEGNSSFVITINGDKNIYITPEDYITKYTSVFDDVKDKIFTLANCIDKEHNHSYTILMEK